MGQPIIKVFKLLKRKKLGTVSNEMIYGFLMRGTKGIVTKRDDISFCKSCSNLMTIMVDLP